MRSENLVYGPNSALIRRFLQHLAALDTDSERQATSRYGRLSPSAKFAAAELALAVLLSKAGREQERDALAGPLLLLVQERASTANSEHGTVALLRPVAEPALSALLALLMRDLLPPGDFAALYEPFAVAIPFERLQ